MLLAAAAILFCGAAVASEPVASKQRVMVFGDSLSAAYNLDASQGWVSLLAAKLAPQGIAVINASFSGETTGGGRGRIAADLARHKPDMVLIELGANDGLRGLPIKDMKTNLEAMIAACRAAGAAPVLVGMQIPPNYGIDYTAQFRDMYAELAARHKTGLVPFLLDGIADKPELFQADRLHPIASAQARLVDNVLPVILKAAAPAKPPAKRPG